jgi:hypothetical protein
MLSLGLGMKALRLIHWTVGLLLCCGGSTAAWADRSVASLSGPWEFQRADTSDWKTVTVPSSFEEHEGVEFDGVGIYRKRLAPIELPAGARAILHFQAVATECDVLVDGQRVGTHLGGWTPWRLDITDQLRSDGSAEHELVVRVDEKVGHNSQGFLPVVAPHFGGIWQDVQLLVVPSRWIDERQLLAVGDPASGSIHLDIPVRGGAPSSPGAIDVRYRLRGTPEWSPPRTCELNETTRHAAGESPSTDRTNDLAEWHTVAVPVADWKWWSLESPQLYEVEIVLRTGSADAQQASDRVTTRVGFRTMQVEGSRLLLNGQPLSTRGMLNWGYAPPRVAPSIDEEHMRTELQLARALGFNLMKFCLWIPPQRYLEIADEMGMLTWMEYPTWHSKWSPDQLPTLEKEFTEFFYYDRNHASILLRSLTCETGTTADLNVIRTLYERCHSMVPHAIVEDDSSWIAWNRIHDFYDDHPYGNNHTWVATLSGLTQHIRDHGSKPLVLGESISADTWVDHDELLKVVGDERPFWLPRFFAGQPAWLEQMKKIAGSGGLDKLTEESKWYGLLMRKYQIETYRREVPDGGYVVSVVRDVPSCSMGFLDYLGRPKWSADDWKWHGETMLLLETEADRRSFFGGETFHATPLISHFGSAPIDKAELTLRVETTDPGVLRQTARKVVSVEGTGLSRLEPLDIVLPAVNQPTRFVVFASLKAGDCEIVNQWPMWIVPSAASVELPQVCLHESCPDALRELFPGAEPLAGQPTDGIVVTTRLDPPLMELLAAGGKVLLFADGQKGSFPTSDEWFLRGAPYIPDHPLSAKIPREMFLELQHFDLAGPVIPDVAYVESVTPILMLWFTHDLPQVKTQGLVFETRVGRGRLLVSALRHTSASQAAGPWLARIFADHLAHGPLPQSAVDAQTVKQLKATIETQPIDLTPKT